MRLSASAWMAGAATTVIGVATVAVVAPGGASPVRPGRAASVPAHVRSVSFPKTGGGAGGPAAPAVLRLPDVTPFSLLGVTWDDPGATLRAAIELRTKDARTGRWTGWHGLDADAELGPDSGPEAVAPRRRGGTDPLWVGPSRGVEVRAVPRSGGVKRLPAGLRLELVDPGSAPGEPATLGRLRRASQEIATVSTPTSLLSRFEILVDGTVVATASASARSAVVRVSTGSHKLQVRGVHLRGTSAATAPVSVVSDAVAPAFSTAARLELRTGGVGSTSAPVWLRWRASDATALRAVDLLSPVTTTFTPAATSYAGTARIGASTWTLRARDWAGNTTTSSIARTTVLSSDSSAARTGAWSTRTVRIVVAGTSGRPRVTADGLLRIN